MIPMPNAEVAAELGIELVELEDVFRRADFADRELPADGRRRGIW